jgi:glycosyltransferase involved in cell wall biosynthesis
MAAQAAGEPFGRTLVEAILSGVPYVASSGSGHTEIHERCKGGKLVPEDADATFFADRLLEVMRGLESYRLTADGIALLRSDFSLHEHAKEVEAVYELLFKRAQVRNNK